MKKKVAIIAIIIVLLIVFIIILFKLNNYNEIPNGYIAVFHGGVGEQTYETYIYKQNNKPANYGFDYINITSTTISYGSSQWNKRITKKGSVQWTDDVFIVAKEKTTKFQQFSEILSFFVVGGIRRFYIFKSAEISIL